MITINHPTDSSKRKRTSRACNQCRGRKARCDGNERCKSCVDTGIHCSYSDTAQPTSGPKYIAHLEHKVDALEARLRNLNVASDGESESSQVTYAESRTRHHSSSPLAQVDSALSTAFVNDRSFRALPVSFPSEASQDIVDTLRFNPEEQASQSVSVYRGKTTGVEIVRGLIHLCDTFVGFSTNAESSAANMVNALDAQAPYENLPKTLPASSFFCFGPVVRKWIDLAFEECFVLWPFIDQETFNTHVQELLESDMIDQGGFSNDQIGLLHSVIALGQRHDPTLVNLDGERSQSAETRGFRHFAAARELVPLDNCTRSVTAVQTVLCMALYLKSVSALRAVHT